jgi:hypothetical protein
MVLYTELVAARDASSDEDVRIRRRQSGVGARDAGPLPHPTDNVSRFTNTVRPSWARISD